LTERQIEHAHGKGQVESMLCQLAPSWYKQLTGILQTTPWIFTRNFLRFTNNSLRITETSLKSKLRFPRKELSILARGCQLVQTAS
jgi:hypothetical protein